MGNKGKQQALDTTLATLTKRFGEGAIMRLGEATHMTVEIIPTGALSLDIALGVGGIPVVVSPKSMARTGRARQHWPNTSSPRRRKWAGSLLTLTWSTRWTPPMPPPAAWM